MRKLILLTAILLPVAALAAKPAKTAKPAKSVSLVQNEYDFAATVAKTGIRDGFLQYFDKQAVTFAPKPVNGFDYYTGRKPNSTQLLWYPSFALVSSDGNFGVDTGPWTAHWMQDGKEQTAYGEWLSIWHRDDSGTWKTLFDAGLDHEPEDKAAPLAPGAKVAQLPGTGAKVPAEEDVHDGIIRAETVFTNDANSKSLREAYMSAGSDDIRVMMQGGLPLLGLGQMAKVVPDVPAELIWAPMGGSAAKSGDLGYVYGMTYKPGDTSHLAPLGTYMHVWKRDVSGWKLIIAEEIPLPKQ
jgi:ketosteroid isomerase-like protein